MGMTYYGFNQASGPLGGDCLAVSATEWELCTSASFVANSKTQLAYALVTGQAASAARDGYILPTTLPDGNYTATRQAVTGLTVTCEHSDVCSCSGSGCPTIGPYSQSTSDAALQSSPAHLFIIASLLMFLFQQQYHL